MTFQFPFQKNDRSCVMIGAPFAEGQALGGVDLCPDAFRKGNISKVVSALNWNFEDVGNLEVERADGSPATTASSTDTHSGAATKLSKAFGDHEDPYVLNVKNSLNNGRNNERLFNAVYNAALENKFTLSIGGDHAIASGSISGMLKARPSLGLLWIDAHGDCNTPETSPSGNYHGMPVAHILGWFKKQIEGFEWMDDCPKLPETRLAFIGLRDLDISEKKLLKESKIKCFTMKDVDRMGISKVMDLALAHISDESCSNPLYLSLDIDAVDPAYAPGTGTLARGGLTYREVHYICETICETGRLCGMDLVEINPDLDPNDAVEMHGDDPEIIGGPTVRLGIELVCSALGKNIL